MITLACRQDYEGFYRREIALRRELTFPPFCHIAQFTLTGTEEGSVEAAAREFGELAARRAEAYAAYSGAWFSYSSLGEGK